MTAEVMALRIWPVGATNRRNWCDDTLQQVDVNGQYNPSPQSVV
jgi:hypothetical protein